MAKFSSQKKLNWIFLSIYNIFGLTYLSSFFCYLGLFQIICDALSGIQTFRNGVNGFLVRVFHSIREPLSWSILLIMIASFSLNLKIKLERLGLGRDQKCRVRTACTPSAGTDCSLMKVQTTFLRINCFSCIFGR
jgi:hypothetical protein